MSRSAGRSGSAEGRRSTEQNRPSADTRVGRSCDPEPRERLRRELRFDDFEHTLCLTNLQTMVEVVGLQMEEIPTRGLHGAAAKARKTK